MIKRPLSPRSLGLAALWIVGISAFPTGAFASETLIIGGLLSLTGSWSSLGKSSKIIMQLARDDINTYLKHHRSNKRVRLMIEDTQLQPEIAKEKYQQLVARKAVAVVGPQSSTEIATLAGIVGKMRVPLVSQGSTASSLAEPDDAIYRMVPNDTHEAEAVQALLSRRGIQTLIPLWRDDVGNNGLHQSLQSRFEAVGGKVYPGVQYTPDQQDFSSVAATAAAQLAQALAEVGGDTARVAIYTASFDEIVPLMKAAAAFPTLKTVKWFGSDGVVQSTALSQDPVASRFAIDTGYPSPNFGLSAAAQRNAQSVSERYAAITGQLPDAFTLAAYDATWVAALGSSYQSSVMARSRQDVLGETAKLHFGATGWAELDLNGDRTRGDYDFWALRPDVSGTAVWTIVCHYDSETGKTTDPCE